MSTLTATYSIASGADDQEVYKIGPAWPPDGSAGQGVAASNTYIKAEKYFGSPNYVCLNALLSFQTSIPPGATVTAATLRMYVLLSNNNDNDGRTFTADYYNWTPTVSDFTATAGTSAISGVALTSITVSADNDFTLSSPAANIPTGSATVKLRLHVSGGAPTLATQFWVASYDDATLPEPRLIVTYTVPSTRLAPTGFAA